MNVCFKFAALFHRLYGEGKKAAISKLTYIWTPSSRSYIVFALNILTNFENVNQVIRSISTSLKMRIFLSFNFSLCPSSNANKRAANQQLNACTFFWQAQKSKCNSHPITSNAQNEAKNIHDSLFYTCAYFTHERDALRLLMQKFMYHDNLYHFLEDLGIVLF